METFSPSTNITGQNSLFGYSVTYVPANKKLIVSAPKMSYIGEVFACDIQNKSCEQIHNNITNVSVNKGHYSWLGATVKAGENFFTTCAPRFLTTVFKLKGTYSRCYQFSSAGENFELKLLAQMIKKEISYPPERLMDSFGWSIAVAGQNVTIGGPAVYKGRVIQYTNISSLSLKPKLIDAFNLDINYNFGYSVAAGYFLQKGKISFAFSSPYGEDGHGKIFIYDGKKTVPIKDVKNVPQVGSLFGVSLCSAYAGFRSALLVGAPAYGSEHQYNVGAVYIYEFNRDQRSMEYIKTVYAQKDGGYFGYAMTSLGDLNGDKFDEVAISAPYEDDGRGAVYIYSGKHLISKSKNELTWLQRIQPEQYQGFGLSLSMLEDYDENGCNELAIGAPNNETVVLLRCMASIGLRILKLNPYKETIKSTTTTGPLFKFGSCIEIYYPPKLKTIEADISMTITITHKNCKLENGTVDGTVITFNIPKDVLQRRENKFCQNVTIVTPQEASYDPLVPFKISASLNNDPRNLKVFNPSRVVINERGDSSVTENVYVRECKENKCMPKLNFKVLSSFPDSYIIGSTNTEILRIFITNNGDVAYDVCVTVLIKGVPIKEWPRSCVWNDDTNVLTCKPLILIRNNTIWKNDDILLDTQSLNSKDKAVDVNVKLYTVCGDSLTKEHNISVLLLRDRNLTVTGSTTGGDVVNVTKDNIHYTGKQIQHAYSIYNNGTTTWVNFKMIIELEKQSYIGKYTVNTGDAFDCTDFKETPNMHIITCEVKIIKANRKVEVILSIDLPPVTLGYTGLYALKCQSINEMMEHFNVRMAAFQKDLHKVNNAPLTISSLAADFTAFRAFITDTLGNLQKQVAVLAQQLDLAEMRSRRKILLLHGVEERRGSDSSQDVVKVVKETLKLSDFSLVDITRSHRMGRLATDKPRPILVKFKEETVRNKVWFTKTALKDSGITISEFLTKGRHDAFITARHHFGVKNCWTRGGCVVIITADGTRHRVTTSAEVQMIVARLPAEAAISPETVSSPNHVAKHGQCSADAFSCHDLIFLSYKVRPPKFKHKFLMQRNFGAIDLDSLRRDAQDLKWDTVHNAASVDEQDLVHISDWCKAFGLIVNPMKTQAIVIGSSRYISRINWNTLPRIVFNGVSIDYSEHVKNLGIYFDRTLSWSAQITDLSRKIFGVASSLRRLGNFLPVDTKITLAHTLFLPILDYADTCYPDLTEAQLNKLERLQNICIRFIFGLRKYDRDFLNKQEGAIIVSHLKIFLHNDQKFHSSIKSRLLLYNIEVPLWIIISATLVGLLLLVILALILHECGCLRRKNKEKLKELKKDVKRQSMRRSMMVRDSPRTSRPIDIQPLISSLDSEEFSGTYNQVPKPVPVEIAPTALPKVDTPKSPATAVTAPVIAASANVSLAPISSLSVTPKVTPTPPSKPSTKPNDRSESESQNKIRADLILGGLQKNLAKQHSLGGSTSSLTKI
ncbi:uncharacterized protein ACR2FA_002828 [Aphomia sociella]